MLICAGMQSSRHDSLLPYTPPLGDRSDGKKGGNKIIKKNQDFHDFCLIWEMGGPNYVQKARFLLTSILPYRTLNSEKKI